MAENTGEYFAVTTDEEEEEEELEGDPITRAYFAGRHDAEEGFGAAYRGTRAAPHGGSKNVFEAHGAPDLCWCGQPLGHEWPGKKSGLPHPKEIRKMTAQQQDQLTPQMLRGFKKPVIDALMELVNHYGVRYRITSDKHILLYPPDGESQPYRFSMERDATASLRFLLSFKNKFLAEVTGTQIEKLAETLNDPEEHPKKGEKKAEKAAETVEEEAQVPEPELVKEAPTEETTEAQIVPEGADTEGLPEGWWWHYKFEPGRKTQTKTIFRTNGTAWVCTVCEAVGEKKPEDYTFTSARSLGGHTRMWHLETSKPQETLWGPEAREAAQQTRLRNQRRDAEAVKVLADFLGVQLSDPETDKTIAGLRERIADLEIEKATLEAAGESAAHELSNLAGQVVEATKRAEEAETKMKVFEDKMAALAMLKEML